MQRRNGKRDQISCAYCLQHGRVVMKQQCKGCGNCIEHRRCTCTPCTRCAKKNPPSLRCKICLACKEHHVDMRGTMFPHRKCDYILEGVRPPAYHLNTLRRALGIELEVAETLQAETNTDLKRLGTWTHDGSVKPSELEFGTKPLRGDEFLETTTKILDIIHSYGSKVNATCGFHVHVDSADLSAAELRRVFVGFTAVQRGIFGTLVEDSRKDNQFCGLVNLGSESLHAFMDLWGRNEIMYWLYNYLYKLTYPDRELLGKDYSAAQAERMYNSLVQDYKGKLQNYRSHKYMNEARRQAINFHSWMMRGTIEFRMKEGTLAASEVMNWPLWCGWFVDRTAACTDQEIRNWIRKPPSVLEITKSWYGKGVRPAPGLVDWVAEKAAHPTKAVPAPESLQTRRNRTEAAAAVAARAEELLQEAWNRQTLRDAQLAQAREAFGPVVGMGRDTVGGAFRVREQPQFIWEEAAAVNHELPADPQPYPWVPAVPTPPQEEEPF